MFAAKVLGNLHFVKKRKLKTKVQGVQAGNVWKNSGGSDERKKYSILHCEKLKSSVG